MHLIVNPRQVGDSGSLTNSAELVVDGSVAKADPALVSTEIRHRDAAQVSADSGSAYNRGVAGIRDRSL